MLKKVTKNTVKATIRKCGSWTGWIVPNKVSEYHIQGGWHMGMQVTLGTEDYPLEATLNNFKFYNCTYETGYRVAFYQ